MVTIAALIIFLVCLLFVKSTIIYEIAEGVRETRVSVVAWAAIFASAFVPVANWIVMIICPFVILIWYSSNGFDDYQRRRIELSDKTVIGRIFLFKI